MKNHLIYLTSLLLGTTLATATVSYTPVTIRSFANYTLVGTWDSGNTVELDAGDESLDTNPTTPGLFESIYGDISGNTICRSDFVAQVAAAYSAGLGGVIDFEDVNLSYSTEEFSPTIARTGADKISAGGLITISRGPNWWYEGSYTDSPWGPYRGKQTSFDGTGPSGPDRANYADIFFITQTGTSEPGQLGMGQTTSYDLDFDPADKVVIIGFAQMNWDGNFQSQQDQSRENVFYPNVHAIATFTNGVHAPVTQMAVALTSIDPGNDHYFGFEAPEGYYLDRLQVYAIGNNARVFITIDDLGFIMEDPTPPTPVLAAEDLDITSTESGVSISYTSINGLLHTLEHSSDLNAPWCDIDGPVTGDGSIKSFVVDPAPADKGFYRIRTQ